ncbi:MAG TPA: hypothetical protein VJ717_17385 [Gemmatimonadaceae bacterium]|nr:hypothetical protein [Gemmatimonadaceae bacterium]
MPKPVRPRDRLLNVVASICILSGAGLFFLARRALSEIAEGELALSSESALTNVAFTDSVVLRSRVGLWLVVVGAILAVAAAISHRFRRSA